MKTKLDFLLYSPPKTGSTSLACMLDMHPQISAITIPNESKEPGLFNTRNIISDEEIIQYNGCFKDDSTLKFEKSTSYFSSPSAAKHIKNFCKEDIKFITVLRNPVDKLISLYKYFRIISTIHEKKLDNQAAEILQFEVPNDEVFYNFPTIKELLNDNTSWEWVLYSGVYHQHLDRLYRLFNSQSILLINYDDFKTNTLHCLESILNFLNVDIQSLDKSSSNIVANSSQLWEELCFKLDIPLSCTHIEDKYLHQIKEHYYRHNDLLKQKYSFDHNWND